MPFTPDPDTAEALARVVLAASGEWRGNASQLRVAMLPHLPADHPAHEDGEPHYVASRARASRHLAAERYGVYLIRHNKSKAVPFVLRLTPPHANSTKEPTP